MGLVNYDVEFGPTDHGGSVGVKWYLGVSIKYPSGGGGPKTEPIETTKGCVKALAAASTDKASFLAELANWPAEKDWYNGVGTDSLPNQETRDTFWRTVVLYNKNSWTFS